MKDFSYMKNVITNLPDAKKSKKKSKSLEPS